MGEFSISVAVPESRKGERKVITCKGCQKPIVILPIVECSVGIPDCCPHCCNATANFNVIDIKEGLDVESECTTCGYGINVTCIGDKEETWLCSLEKCAKD